MFTGHVDKSGEISFSKKVNNSKWRLELYLIAGNYNEKGIFPRLFARSNIKKGGLFKFSRICLWCWELIEDTGRFLL